MTIPRLPCFERKPHHFNPAILVTSVIASPLLEQIEQELAVTVRIEKDHPHIRDAHNVAIFLHPDFLGGPTAALNAVRTLLPEAVKKVGSNTPQSVDAPDPKISDHVALASIEGAIIRQLLGMDAANAQSAIEHIWPTRYEVIIDINLAFKPLESGSGKSDADVSEFKHPDPRRVAKKLIKKYIEKAKKAARVSDSDQGVDMYKTEMSSQYVFARLEVSVIKKLVEIDQREAQKWVKKATKVTPEVVAQAVGRKGKATNKAIDTAPTIEVSRFRTIHHIWPDFDIQSCITQSIRTVKVDAAQRSFTASGDGITWAVMDTGIDGLHPHFKLHGNIDASSPYHADFTGSPGGAKPLQDNFGHGTHVAGIIAGEQSLKKGSDTTKMFAVSHVLDENGKKVIRKELLESVSGMAPKCKLVSLNVLDEFGIGKASNVIAAISHVQLLNGHGRDLKIHGVNLSLGHPFDPKWFACGHSPLCVEVNRLVKSGVVVVVTAGNTGYGSLQTKEGATNTCLDLTINDPGNAECAITVGSTHRDMPHMYGVSYFSSKGPTGDGRCKPDLLAPGEKIISCAAPNSTLLQRETDNTECYYFENSGTSMAAPHVSGAVAAFLSIRNEFKGEAEKVKHIFTSTATDLGRDRYFQGAGLVDLMRAIQSV
ncbi:MAG: S8 family peptidase [Candidatus Nitrotoga sp.]